jgi:hypothetical protein
VLDGQPIISGLRFSNTSTATQQTMLAYACDGFDPTSLRLFDGPHPASSTAQMQSIPSAGSPVWMSGFTMTPSPSLLKVEYGTGAVTNKSQARCDDADSPTGWTTDPADPILATILASSQQPRPSPQFRKFAYVLNSRLESPLRNTRPFQLLRKLSAEIRLPDFQTPIEQ